MRFSRLAPLAFLLFGTAALAQLPLTGAGGSGSVVPSTNNSLIFTSASSQYLSATGKTSINQQKFTIAFWFKTTASGTQLVSYFGDGTTANRVILETSNGKIQAVASVASSTVMQLTTSSAYNDGAWHHGMLAVDTTQATVNNRGIIYVDGAAAALGTNTQPVQNATLANNYAASYMIGTNQAISALFNGNMAQFYYIDGQQLTPSSFISDTPGVPITYTGTYTGTFDFFLSFSNGTSTTTLGADSSGEGNNWTLNNMTTANQSTDYP